jgi:hypothetical protein
MDEAKSFASWLTLPAKLAFGAYMLLLWFESQSKTVHFNRLEFFLVAALFMVVQIGHDDWLRIILNDHATRKDMSKRKALKLVRNNELTPNQPQ